MISVFRGYSKFATFIDLPGACRLLAGSASESSMPIQCSELLPQVAVEDTVVNRFVQMMELDVVGGFEVGDRAGQTQDFVVGSSAESHFVDVDS